MREGGEEIFPCGSSAPLKSLTHCRLFFLFSPFVTVVTGPVVLPKCKQVGGGGERVNSQLWTVRDATNFPRAPGFAQAPALAKLLGMLRGRMCLAESSRTIPWLVPLSWKAAMGQAQRSFIVRWSSLWSKAGVRWC